MHVVKGCGYLIDCSLQRAEEPIFLSKVFTATPLLKIVIKTFKRYPCIPVLIPFSLTLNASFTNGKILLFPFLSFSSFSIYLCVCYSAD